MHSSRIIVDGRRATLAGAIALACLSPQVNAAGFAIIEHSAQGMGNAYSGGAANAEDLSTLWFNPAGAVKFEGLQSQAALHLIIPEFDGRGSGALEAGGVAFPTGSEPSDGGVVAFVPATYVSYQVNEKLWAGLAINAPFGLSTNYDDDWAGRYQAIDSEILSFNIGPSLAFKVSDSLSIGVGVVLMYFDAKLPNAIDTNGAAASGLSARAQAAAAAGDLVTAQALGAEAQGVLAGRPFDDSRAKNEADGWGYGFNVGLLFEPVNTADREIRIGVHYRSEIEQDLEGKASFRLNPVLTPGGAVPVNLARDDISVNVDLPQKVSASYYHRVRKVAFMGDVTWTGWSSLPELKIEYDGVGPFGTGEAVEEVDFEDSFRLSAGVAYYYNDRWTWRAGAAWDQSPTRNSRDRTARLPDNDRVWFSAGVGYN